MPPSDPQSMQCWYHMLLNMFYMGIGYMATGQLHKAWLLQHHKHNQTMLKVGVDSGTISPYQFTEFEKLGQIIATFPEH